MDVPRSDCVILNSANLYEKAVEHIQQGKYEYVRMWLDNDGAGRKFEEALVERLKNLKADISLSRMNHIYDGFKDLNAWHSGANIDLSSKKNILLDFVKVLDVKTYQPDRL
jgi:5S rRNA maturation endonuclease (ribonuclease M5)